VNKKKKFPSYSSVNVIWLRGLTAIFAVFSLLFVITPKNQTIICGNSISCAKNLSIDVENGATGIFNNHPISVPYINLNETPPTTVLGDETAQGQKHIYVDLTTQTLTAYQGDTLFMKTFISSGKWHDTPTGDFTIWVKLRSTRMSGGTGEDYYNLPNVPYTMFFYNKDVPKASGFSLHGAYWHNNFGHPMSHGCVNMRTIDAEKLYNWAMPETKSNTTYATEDNPGTIVTIYGQAPL
jgi:hypothetical protein